MRASANIRQVIATTALDAVRGSASCVVLFADASFSIAIRAYIGLRFRRIIEALRGVEIAHVDRHMRGDQLRNTWKL